MACSEAEEGGTHTGCVTERLFFALQDAHQQHLLWFKWKSKEGISRVLGYIEEHTNQRKQHKAFEHAPILVACGLPDNYANLHSSAHPHHHTHTMGPRYAARHGTAPILRFQIPPHGTARHTILRFHTPPPPVPDAKMERKWGFCISGLKKRPFS